MYWVDLRLMSTYQIYSRSLFQIDKLESELAEYSFTGCLDIWKRKFCKDDEIADVEKILI